MNYMKTIKSLAPLILSIMLLACTKQENYTLTSPDGNIQLTFAVADKKPVYALSQNGEEVIRPSALGFILSENDYFDRDFVVVGTARSQHDETWQPVWGEESEIRSHYNELKVELQEVSGLQRRLDIVFRAFDDGIGFRYEFPEQEHLGAFEIMDEVTEFALAADHDTWSIPAYKGEYYEMLYRNIPASQLDTVCLPLTMETRTGGYLAIHEANLTDYAALNVYPVAGITLKADLTPWSTGVKVYAEAPCVTPWRTITLADDLNALVNSRIMLNLNEPCRITDTSWIRPMKYIGIWWGMHMEQYTWAQGPKHGATTANTKQYIDFAARHGIQGVLVEGWNYGWDGDWSAHGDQFDFDCPYPDYDLDELSRYAASKGVALIGHHETGGATLNYEKQLDDAFRFLNAHGIHAVKTGYVNKLLDHKELHSSQYGVRHYRKVVEAAAKYQITVDNHEPVMPTGLQRTYLNFMSHEGVRGAEYDAWSPDGGNPPEHTTVLPFTRGLAGPIDYTFGTFHFTNPVHPQTRVQSTLPKQLALYVIIYSPLQMASDLPEHYDGNPAFRFIEDVPVDWAKSIVLDGKIGDFVVTARQDKHSTDWYVGGITDEQPRTVAIDFSFLEDGKHYTAQIYRDAPDSDWKTNPYPVVMEEITIDANSQLNLYLAPGGGAALRIKG